MMVTVTEPTAETSRAAAGQQCCISQGQQIRESDTTVVKLRSSTPTVTCVEAQPLEKDRQWGAAIYTIHKVRPLVG